MFCSQCGAENSGDGKFCWNCGEQLQQPAQQSGPVAASATASSNDEMRKLEELYAQGLITAEEFNAKKAQMNGEAVPVSAPASSCPVASMSQIPLMDSKSKVVAGLLAIFVGTIGIHKFYLGYTAQGVIMICITILGALILIGPLITGIISLIEGIIYLTRTDAQFYETYVLGKKGWF